MLELDATTEQQVAGVHIESVPIVVGVQPGRAVLFPQLAQPVMFGSNGRALLGGDALRWRSLLPEAAKAMFVRTAPVDVQLTTGGKLHSAGEMRSDVAHWGDGAAE
ncbi:hypothetical protein D3C80_1653260 [compost metagenome]